jgi:Na+/melibiose symporter-like transporter
MTIGTFLDVIASVYVALFFTVPYAFPAEIAADEASRSGKDRAGMYFAVQGLINQLVGSLAGSVLALLPV